MTPSKRLTTAQIVIARRIRALKMEAEAKQQALQAELDQRAEALTATYQERMLSEWSALFVSAGIPAEEMGHWGLDMRYTDDHELAFLERLGQCSCGQDHGDGGELPGFEGLLANLNNLGKKRVH